MRGSFTVRSGSREWVVAIGARIGASQAAVDRASAAHLAEGWCRDADLVRDQLLHMHWQMSGGGRVDAAQLKAWICRAFARGELVILAGVPPVAAKPSGGGGAAAAEPAPAPPPPRKPTAPAPPPLPEGPALPAALVDQKEQAQALIQAAQSGVPFCEECEKARQAQAANSETPRG